MLGAIDQSYLYEVLDALLAHDGPTLLAVSDNMQARSMDFEAALQELATLLHRVVLAQTVPQAIAEDEPERERLLQLTQRFSAEELQLFYQIAIHGRNEIALAPDEYAGFTMTLLRMLAFMPAGAQAPAARPQTMNAAPAAVPAATTMSATTARQPAPPVAQELQPQPVAASAAELDWPSLLGQLSVQGTAKELAKNCTLASFADGRLQLNLAPEHKLLNSKMAHAKLQTALGDYFAQPVKLTVTLGTAGAATPAAVEQREKMSRQQEAVVAIRQDAFVREAQAELGAKLVEDSIKPI